MAELAAPSVITWVTFGIAILGVLQPGAIVLYRRYFRARKISIYQQGRLDIGFSSFGPCLGMTGLIRNENVPSVLTTLDLVLTNLDDGRCMTLRPFLNRSRKVSDSALGVVPTIEATTWVAFQIERDNSIPFDVTFAHAEIRRTIEGAMQNYLATLTAFVAVTLREQPIATERERIEAIMRILPTVSEQPFHREARAVLANAMLWTAGRYELAMVVSDADETRTFRKTWNLRLTSDEIAGLTANIDRVLLLHFASAAQLVVAITDQLFYAYPVCE